MTANFPGRCASTCTALAAEFLFTIVDSKIE